MTGQCLTRIARLGHTRILDSNLQLRNSANKAGRTYRTSATSGWRDGARAGHELRRPEADFLRDAIYESKPARLKNLEEGARQRRNRP